MKIQELEIATGLHVRVRACKCVTTASLWYESIRDVCVCAYLPVHTHTRKKQLCTPGVVLYIVRCT